MEKSGQAPSLLSRIALRAAFRSSFLLWGLFSELLDSGLGLATLGAPTLGPEFPNARDPGVRFFLL